jgi:rhodanese-related sulfurtransferase
MKSPITTFLAFLGSFTLTHGAEVVPIDSKAAVQWLAKTPTAQILDVRTKEEFATGHLANSTLIPWTDKDFKTRVEKELDPTKPVFVYCRSGGRSAQAAAALVKAGFKDVTDLAGGITGWQKAGNPISKPE